MKNPRKPDRKDQARGAAPEESPDLFQGIEDLEEGIEDLEDEEILELEIDTEVLLDARLICQGRSEKITKV